MWSRSSILAWAHAEDIAILTPLKEELRAACQLMFFYHEDKGSKKELEQETFHERPIAIINLHLGPHWPIKPSIKLGLGKACDALEIHSPASFGFKTFDGVAKNCGKTHMIQSRIYLRGTPD